MQNLLGTAAAIRNDGALPYALGAGRLGLVDTRDVGAFAARVHTDPAGHAGKTYTLTGPASLSGAEIARTLAEAAGRPVTYVPVPLDAARTAMLELGASPWMADALVEYSRAYSAGWGDLTTDDFPRVMARAARPLAAFARDHAAAFGGTSP
jgi:uncharacterized protein YbjT (DUF2867 family)